MKCIKPIIALSLLFCLHTANGQIDCYNLDGLDPDLIAGESYGTNPGDTIAKPNSLIITAEPYIDGQGDLFFFETKAEQTLSHPDFHHGLETVVSNQNINTRFHFPNNINSVVSYQIHFISYGRGINFAINQQSPEYFPDFNSIPTQISPETQFFVTEAIPSTQGSNSIVGVFTILSTEPISDFVVGGKNLVIDNICISTLSECIIFNPLVIPVCNSDGSIAVQLYSNFMQQQPSNLNVQITGNGNNYGNYVLDNSNNPIVINNFQQYGPFSNQLEFNIAEENGRCFTPFEIKTPNCQPGNCEINDLVFDANLCDANGEFWADLDFISNRNASDSFDLKITDGTFNIDFGRFSYSELPLSVGPLSDTLLGPDKNEFVWEVTVSDAIDLDCRAEITVSDSVFCKKTCVFTELKIANSTCLIDSLSGSYDSLQFDLDFDTTGVEFDSFQVFFARNLVGIFDYRELPLLGLTVQNTGGDMKAITVSEYSFRSDQNSSCQTTQYFRTPCLDCPENLNATIISSPNTNGDYTVRFDMAVPATNGEFELSLDNILIDTFSYDDLPLALDFNCAQFSDSTSVSVAGLGLNNCSKITSFYQVNCDVCDLPRYTAMADCRGNSYDLFIEFDQNTAPPIDVELYVNDVLIGNYNTGINITETNLTTFSTQNLDIKICKVDATDCCSEQTISNPCFGFQPCDIQIRNATATACDANGFFNINLDVEAINSIGTNFLIFVNNDLQVTANYQPGVQSFVLGPFDGQTANPFEIIVFDTNDRDCITNFNLPSPNCNPNPCDISNISFDVTNCVGTNFNLTNLSFDVANAPSDSFQITVDNQPIGFYRYSDLPLNLDNLAHDGDDRIDVRICDKDNSFCCAELSVDFICDDCGITDFQAAGIDCDTDQQFFFLLNGNISTAQTNDTFEIRVNNFLVEKIGNADFAAFAGSGIQIGPFDGTGGINYDISIQSRTLPNCRAIVQSDFECPRPPCVLSDLQLEAQACAIDQTYLLDIDFQFANTRSDSFFLNRNGLQFGKYAYTDLPITIGPFFGNGGSNMYSAFDADEFNCRLEGSFISPNCPAPPCQVRDLDVTTNTCDVDGNFSVTIEFIATNTASNFFELYVNGTLFDTYRFSQLPITAGSFSGDGSNYEFQVKDAGNSDCQETTNITAPNCPQPQCEIRDLNIGAFACDSDDNFDVEIDFNYQNTTSANFELLVNGFNVGTYAYADLPIIVESLTGNGATYTFTVRDEADFNCTDATSFIAPDCTSDNCDISNFSATAGACDNDANFPISLDFDFQNMASDSFNLFINSSPSGTYAYTDLPISAGMFPANGSIVGFAASDQVDATCSETTTISSPTCTPIPCVFSNFLAEASDCNANNEFMVDIDFDHDAASDSFSLFVNDIFYKNYSYTDLFITVGPFDGDGSTLNFEVRDLDDANCSTAGSLTSPDCTPCELTDVFSNTTDCDLNGQFFYEIDIVYANTSDSFTLNLLGNAYNRTFSYSDLPVLAGPFDGDGSTVHQFMVSDQAEPNCNLNYSVLAPNCICSIRDVSAQASDCDALNFNIELDFVFENTSDSFSVSTSGFTQNFAYANLPVILGPFDGNGQTNTYQISDLVRTNCNEDFTITAPDCTPPCSLTNPIIATNCDNQGNFTATIDFDHSNTPSDFFNTNGYGIFAYADLPVTIGDFLGDGVTDYTVEITDGSDPNCSLPIIVPAKYCGDSCQIYNVQVSTSDCDNMGMFEMFLEFDSENTNANGFLITVNSQAIGPLPYSTPQPISLGSFFGDAQTSYNVFVLDAGDATCSGSAKVDPVNCLPCDLSDIITQITPCDNDGNFFVTLDFTAQSGSPLGFSITGNGNNYGSYSYSDLPISLPDTFAGDGTSVYEFVVTDMEVPDCTISTTVGPVDCNTDKCRIFDVIALPTDCNPNGEFSVELSFNYQDVGNSGFTVRGNGMIYGDDFEYDQVPIQIDNLLGDGLTVYEFFVIDNENSDCNNFTTVGPIDCDDGACGIDSLQVEIIDCNGNGTYEVSIDFNYDNPTNTLFDVFTTRGFFATYQLSQLPLIIPNFPSNGNPFEAVRVCMADNRLCCASTFFPTPDCDGDCIEFERLPYDTTFIDSINTFIGDTLLIENSVLMTTNVFLSATGAVLDSIAADSANVLFDAADGIQFTTHNATIDFQFPILTGGTVCREVTFNYYQTGDVNNISINGSPVQLFNRFDDLPFNIAPFVFVEVFPTNAREGVLKLKGFVNSVRLGGEEVAFDNICYGECLNLLSVWPGDINLDNWVSHLDILQFGVGYDAQGPARLDQTTNFEELPADDWLRYFGRGQNYKHADCNGDGLVDDDDLGVMGGNYGLFHDNIIPFPIEPTQPSAPKLFIEYPDPATIQAGVPFTGKIVLGEDTNPVFNAYGLAFTLRYDRTKFSITDINYPPSWLGDESEDLRSIDQIYPNDGLAHIGISRINKENVTGSGAVAEFIGIIDDIIQRTEPIDIEIDGITAISKDEFPVPIGGSISELDWSTGTIDLPNGVLNVYPNPTNDKVFFSLPENQTLDFVEVTSADGKVFETLKPQANHLTLNHYTPGMYVLKFMIDGQPYYDRIIKQ